MDRSSPIPTAHPNTSLPTGNRPRTLTWFQLAIRECVRRPLRSAVAVVGMATSIGAAFTLLAFQHGYREGLARELARLGAHILVVPKGCPYDAASLALHGASWPCHLKASYLDEVRRVPGVAVAAPVFMTAQYDPKSGHRVYLGIDTNMLALKPAWQIHGSFPQSGEVLAGADVARIRGWTRGQAVDLPGTAPRSSLLSGVLSPTETPEDAFVFLPLGDAQKTFHHTNELTHLLIRLTDPQELDRVVADLRGCDAGMHMNIVPLAHLFRSIQSLVNSTRWFLRTATLVALLAAAAGLSAALLIAVTERGREIGVLRALGASPGSIFRLIWIESVILSTAGSVAGVAAGFAGMLLAETALRPRLPFAPAGTLMVWEWWIAGTCMLAGILLATVAALAPAWRAAEVPPARAMREKGILW